MAYGRSQARDQICATAAAGWKLYPLHWAGIKPAPQGQAWSLTHRTTAGPPQFFFLFLSKNSFYYLFIYCLFRATPAAYGSSQARGWNGTVATGLHHSHSNAGSELSVSYTTAHGSAGSLIHWARPGIEPATSWMLVRFVNQWATTGTPPTLFSLFHLKNDSWEFPSWLAKWGWWCLWSTGSIPGQHSGKDLVIQPCHSCGSDLIPGLGTPHASGWPKHKKNKERNKMTIGNLFYNLNLSMNCFLSNVFCFISLLFIYLLFPPHNFFSAVQHGDQVTHTLFFLLLSCCVIRD